MSRASRLRRERRKCYQALDRVRKLQQNISNTSTNIEDALKIGSYYKIDENQADNNKIQQSKVLLNEASSDLNGTIEALEERIEELTDAIIAAEDDD